MTFLQAQGILSSYHCINVFVLWLGLFGVLYLYIPFSLLLVRLSDHFPLMKWHKFSLFLSFFCECAVCSKPDDPEETSWPPEARRLLPGRQQDDLSEPGGVFRPRVAKPASGGVVSHQPRLHRLRGAGQCPALQEAHRGPALPAAAVARWLVYFSFCLKSVNATSSPILKEHINYCHGFCLYCLNLIPSVCTSSEVQLYKGLRCFETRGYPPLALVQLIATDRHLLVLRGWNSLHLRPGQAQNPNVNQTFKAGSILGLKINH